MNNYMAMSAAAFAEFQNLMIRKEQEILTAGDLDRISVLNTERDHFYADGRSAIVPVTGYLMQTRDPWLDFFGVFQTGYDDVLEILGVIKDSDEIDDVVLAIDSAGGDVADLSILMRAVREFPKPVTAEIRSMAASAAYAVASQADEIIAESSASLVGSIGVLTVAIRDDDIKVITNSASRKKYSDPFDGEEIKDVIETLDSIYEVMVDEILEGRPQIEDAVASLEGRVITAREALKLGLLDKIDGISQDEKKAGPDRREDKKLLSKRKRTPAAEPEPGKTAAADTARAQAADPAAADSEDRCPLNLEIVNTDSAAADSATRERSRIQGILAASGVRLTPEAGKAIESGQDEREYAFELCVAGRNVPAPNGPEISSISGARSPGEDAAKDIAAEKLASDIAKQAADARRRNGGK